jgi:hypothetical protein
MLRLLTRAGRISFTDNREQVQNPFDDAQRSTLEVPFPSWRCVLNRVLSRACAHLSNASTDSYLRATSSESMTLFTREASEESTVLDVV